MSVLASPPSRAPQPWLSLWILIALCVLSFLDRQIIALMVGPIRHQLAVTDFQISLLQGLAFGTFYSVCGLPLGWMVDRYSRRTVIWAGVSTWSLSTIASGCARSFSQLFMARIGVGAGEAALTPAAYSIIADLFPQDKLAFVLSLYATGATIGSSLALVLSGALLNLMGHVTLSLPLLGPMAGWQLVFIVLGLPGLLIAPIIFIISEPTRRIAVCDRTSRTDWQEFCAFLKQRRRLLNLHFVGFGLISMIGYGYLAWLPTYLIRHFGLSAGAAGLSLGLLITCAGIPGGLISGIFVDRLYRRGHKDAHLLYWTWAALGLLVFSIAAFSVNQLWLFFALVAIVQMIAPFSGVAAAAVQLTTPARFRGRTSSLFVLIFNLLGLGLGASTVAAFTDFVFHDDMRVGSSIAASAALLAPMASLMFAFARRPMRAAIEDMSQTPARS